MFTVPKEEIAHGAAQVGTGSQYVWLAGTLPALANGIFREGRSGQKSRREGGERGDWACEGVEMESATKS